MRAETLLCAADTPTVAERPGPLETRAGGPLLVEVFVAAAAAGGDVEVAETAGEAPGELEPLEEPEVPCVPPALDDPVDLAV